MASQLSRAAAPGPAPGGAPGQAPMPDAGSIRNPAVAAAARPGLAAAAALAVDGAAARLAPSLGPSAAYGPAADAQRLAAAVLRAATDTYSLSVVRLADPEHATVAEVGPAFCSVQINIGVS